MIAFIQQSQWLNINYTVGSCAFAFICFFVVSKVLLEHIGRLARMSVLDTEVDGSNPGSSMLFP